MGPLEILAILIIALIVLGPDRMIKSARRIGEGLRELKRAMWKAEQYLEELTKATSILATLNSFAV